MSFGDGGTDAVAKSCLLHFLSGRNYMVLYPGPNPNICRHEAFERGWRTMKTMRMAGVLG